MLVETENRILPMSEIAIDNVRELENLSLKLPQTPINTEHLFHAGMYARTIMIPADVVLTGALIKIATMLIFNGDALVYRDGESVHLQGHHVLAASAHRKQAFVAIDDTFLTMVFPSSAKTVEEAEIEFTDEFAALSSRCGEGENKITVTGE